jgi:hypothetical protein
MCIIRLKQGEFDTYFLKMSDSDIQKYGGIKHLEHIIQTYCDSVNKGEHQSFEIFDLFENDYISSNKNINNNIYLDEE